MINKSYKREIPGQAGNDNVKTSSKGDSHLKVAMRTKEQSSKCCPPGQAGNDNAKTSSKGDSRLKVAMRTKATKAYKASAATECSHSGMVEP